MGNSKESGIAIKNMVCPRCIETVARIARIQGLRPKSIKLGEAVFEASLDATQRASFARELEASGFEIVESYKSQQINLIKTLIIERIHFQGDAPEQNLSDYLSSKLNYNYSRISKLFSSIEGITIERYAMLQRIERAKELLVYDQHSVAETAEELGYSSPAHFSNRFKSETGMTPKQFKKLLDPPRRSIDSI